MLLAELLAAVPVRRVVGSVNRPVRAVTDHHADAGPDDVFVAIRGARHDGHDAVAGLKVAAVVVDHPLAVAPGVVCVEVEDCRAVLGPLAAASVGFPSASMPVIGVTGTNGKTSTTFLLAAIARAAGRKPGIVGTTGHFVGETPIPTAHTTPTAPVFQRLLAQMRDAGCGLVAVEASSIGLHAGRLDGTRFAAAIFTNLSRDHLDYHGDMTAYLAAKAVLFSRLLVADGTAVLNAADPASRELVAPGRRVWTTNTPTADLRVEGLCLRPDGCSGRVVTPMGEGAFALRLVGRHNVENALGALGGALAVGVALEPALVGLAEMAAVPGRLETVPNNLGFTVLVDYAHTDDALRRVLAELRSLTPGRLLTVFGCGGDRDRGKRPLMGQAAGEGSDRIYLTSDNPRSEDPSRILEDVLPGVGGRPVVVEPDRREAIRLAIRAAVPGDVVLIAGKGHENYQEISGVRHEFDDRVEARRALDERLGARS